MEQWRWRRDGGGGAGCREREREREKYISGSGSRAGKRSPYLISNGLGWIGSGLESETRELLGFE